MARQVNFVHALHVPAGQTGARAVFQLQDKHTKLLKPLCYQCLFLKKSKFVAILLNAFLTQIKCSNAKSEKEFVELSSSGVETND